MTSAERRETKAGVLEAVCNIGREEQEKDECFNGGNAVLRINRSVKHITASICPAVISFTDSLSSTAQMICTFLRPYCMRQIKSVEQ